MPMPWSDVVYLSALEEGLNDNGFPDVIEGEKRKVFANKKSIRSSEYYQAKQSGIDLVFTYEIRSIDYEGEEILYQKDDDDAESFEIERTYEDGEFIELVCKKRSDDHGV